VNALITSDEVPTSEPIWLTVARIGAGFRRMEQLANELVELDAVRQDVLTTQAMIRRDIAAAVLQSALCLKEFQSEPELEPELEHKLDAASTSAVVVQPTSAPQNDVWAARLVRWADQFGRDLFRFSPSSKRSPVPAANLRDGK
jgi:hypothetical protein